MNHDQQCPESASACYEELLPKGNYIEYTVDTPGASNRGARRIVVDQDSGRTYYTDDHYRSFIEIDPGRRD